MNNTKKRNLQLTKIIENIAQPPSAIYSSPKLPALISNEVEQVVPPQPADTAFADTAQGFFDLIKKIEEKELGIVLDYEKNKLLILRK